MKVVDISRPDVQSTISEVDKKDSKDGKDSKLRMRMRMRNRDHDAGELENQSNLLRDSDREISGDLANLRLLMAVEDLLDNASSDLVASALAEAASLDQLRTAPRNLPTSFKQSTDVGKRNYSSRESGSSTKTFSAVVRGTSAGHQERQPLFEENNAPVKDDSIKSKLLDESSDAEGPKESITTTKDRELEASEINVLNIAGSNVDVSEEYKIPDSATDVFIEEVKDASSSEESSEQKQEETLGETVVNAEPSVSTEIEHADKTAKDGGGTDSIEKSSEGRHDIDTEAKDNRSNVTSEAEVEDKDGYVTELFDTRSDESSESDKNRQNERGRELLPCEGDLLFNKGTEVIFVLFSYIIGRMLSKPHIFQRSEWIVFPKREKHGTT